MERAPDRAAGLESREVTRRTAREPEAAIAAGMHKPESMQAGNPVRCSQRIADVVL
jgi:hypothetical protein